MDVTKPRDKTKRLCTYMKDPTPDDGAGPLFTTCVRRLQQTHAVALYRYPYRKTIDEIPQLASAAQMVRNVLRRASVFCYNESRSSDFGQV